MPVVLAMVETQVVFTNMLSKTVSPIHLACNTLPRTLTPRHAVTLISAEIAHGHPLLRTRLVLMVVKLLTSRSTTFQTTIPSKELTR
jgi:hypothetical protein